MTPELILSQARSFPEGRPQLVVTVRRSYAIAAGTLTEIAVLPLASAFECSVNRIATDVVLDGHVYLGNTASAVGEIALAGCSRRVRAFGPRVVESVSSAGVSWSPPAPGARVRLSAAEAYGGSLDEAETGRAELDENELFYPRNPEGRGYVTAARAHSMVGSLMPSLEDPESPIAPESVVRQDTEDWLDAPFPPLFGWREPWTFPRCRFLGARLRSKTSGVVPRECVLGVLEPGEIGAARLAKQVDVAAGSAMTVVLEPRAFSAGALGLSNHRLTGGEPVLLRGFFHDMRELSFIVPPFRSVMGVTPPGCPRFELRATLSALMIDADARTATTVEQVALEVAAPYPEPELHAVRVEVLG